MTSLRPSCAPHRTPCARPSLSRTSSTRTYVPSNITILVCLTCSVQSDSSSEFEEDLKLASAPSARGSAPHVAPQVTPLVLPPTAIVEVAPVHAQPPPTIPTVVSPQQPIQPYVAPQTPTPDLSSESHLVPRSRNASVAPEPAVPAAPKPEKPPYACTRTVFFRIILIMVTRGVQASQHSQGAGADQDHTPLDTAGHHRCDRSGHRPGVSVYRFLVTIRC